ncbi:FAD/NAD(P)-binding oxidoreductase [Nocardioides humi]|uniref:FAD/NAD(P)-binding oxidoreductase n=1 Tax=Nocardioides humi TaxID=449461 RepID=A0ABN2AEC2_9ACTN
MSGTILVVGASMAGLRVAERIRGLGHSGPMTVIGDEPCMPYNRPPLSKEALRGEEYDERLPFPIRPALNDVQWRLSTAAVSADLDERRVVTSAGDELSYDGMVIATGLRPRRLDLPGPQAGRHVVRSMADAQALRDALRNAPSVAVVGASFIGCEVAAVAVTLGCQVTVVAPEREPMERVLGTELGAQVRRRHHEAGVTFRMQEVPVAFEGDGAVEAVLLSSGERVPAAVVVEAVGSMPNAEWLGGNGLDLSDGVLCDARMRVEGAECVVAAGDVARFPHRWSTGRAVRVEHWNTVGDIARVAGDSLRHLVTDDLGGHPADEGEAATTATVVPSFWSDQYDLRIYGLGDPAAGIGDVRLLSDADVAPVYGYHVDGQLSGVVGLGGLRSVLPHRESLLGSAFSNDLADHHWPGSK